MHCLAPNCTAADCMWGGWEGHISAVHCQYYRALPILHRPHVSLWRHFRVHGRQNKSSGRTNATSFSNQQRSTRQSLGTQWFTRYTNSPKHPVSWVQTPLFLPNLLISRWAHRVIFLRESGRGVELTTHVYLMSRTRRAILPLAHLRAQRVYLPYSFQGSFTHTHTQSVELNRSILNVY